MSGEVTPKSTSEKEVEVQNSFNIRPNFNHK